MPSSTALKTSLASARVGRLDVSMLLSIWVAVITGMRARWQVVDDPLLDGRHPRHVQLDSQVAAGDHHGVGLGDDRVEIVQRPAASRSWRRSGHGCPVVRARSRSKAMSSAFRTNDSPT